MSLARKGFLLSVVFGFSALSMLLYHLLSAKLLGVEQYGLLNALLSICYTLLFVQYTSQNTLGITVPLSRKHSIEASAFKSLLLIATIVFILIAGLNGVLTKVLHANTTQVLILGLTTFFMIMSFYPQAVFQGRRKYNEYYIFTLISSLAKVGFGLLLFVYVGVEVALLAFLMSFFIPLVYGMWKVGVPSIRNVKISEFLSPAKRILIPVLLLLIMININLLFVRYYFPVESGLYSLILLVDRGFYLFSMFLCFMLVPEVAARRHKKGSERLQVLSKTYFTYFIFSLPVFLCMMEPSWAIGLILPAFLQASAYSSLVTATFFLVGGVNLIGFYLISSGDYKAVYPMLGFLLLEIVLFFLLHRNVYDIFYSHFIVFLGLFLTLSFMLAKNIKEASD
ncbi:hypothetical protein DRN75_01060 [Nanoarchaeota archaeon]|nr:MAG: hypothetical protein DRN75_01060 [Nanoarchaeota archaeon]